MIVVRVELHSAVTGKTLELAKMTISNTGECPERPEYGDYKVRTHRKGSWRIQREGMIQRHPRMRVHVWSLVLKALQTMRY